jgi:hypothetical protein
MEKLILNWAKKKYLEGQTPKLIHGRYAHEPLVHVEKKNTRYISLRILKQNGKADQKQNKSRHEISSRNSKQFNKKTLTFIIE